MKISFIVLLLGLVAGAPCAVLAAAEASATRSASIEFKAIEDFAKAGPGIPKEATGQQSVQAMDKFLLELHSRLKAFYDSHPDSPDRWRAAMMAGRGRPSFITSFGPNYATDSKDVVIDATAKAKFKAEVAALKAALKKATDLPDDLRGSLEASELRTKLHAAGEKGATPAQALAEWTRFASSSIEAVARKAAEEIAAKPSAPLRLADG